MIKINNVKLLDGEVITYECPSFQDFQLDAQGSLTLLPALIDPHFSFGSFERQRAEDAMKFAMRAGFSILLNSPVYDQQDDKMAIEQRKKNCEKLLQSLSSNLKIEHLGNFLKVPEQLGLSKELILGCLLTDRERIDENEMDRFFQMAAWEDLPMVIDLKNNTLWKALSLNSSHQLLKKAIDFAERQSTRLYLLNISDEAELDLIRHARKRSILVYAETTVKQLYQEKQSFLWDAINQGEIETIGSGFCADMQDEELLFKEKKMSISNPLFFLPFLLTSAKEGKCSIEKIIQVCRKNLFDIFKIDMTSDVILVDMDEKNSFKIGQSELPLTGWPVYAILKGNIYSLNEIS